MNKSLLERAREFLRAHQRRHTWYRIVSMLAVVVVFVTTYMLILPAITLETDNTEEVALILVEEDNSGTVTETDASDGSGSSTESSASSTGNENGIVLTIEEIEEVETAPDLNGTSSGETATEEITEAITEEETIEETEEQTEEATENATETGVETDTEIESETKTEAQTEVKTETETEVQTEIETETETELDVAQLLAQITAQKLVTVEAESAEEADGDSNAVIHWLITIHTAQLDVSGWVLGSTVSVNGTETSLDAIGQTISVTEIAANGAETSTTASVIPYTFKTTGTSETAAYQIRFDTELAASEITAAAATVVCSVEFTLPGQKAGEEPAIEIKSSAVGVAAAATETETETESETESEFETETEAYSETESESETEMEIETETETEVESESETETASETETESESETETETEMTSEDESEFESETEIESESETITESETEFESETMTESETESESETMTENETDSESETMAESESETETETETESESDTEELANETLVIETETYVAPLLLGSALAESETEETDTEDETETGTEEETEAETETETETAEDPNAGISLQAAEESGTAVDLTDYITSITFSQLNSSGIWEQLDAGGTYEFAANTSLQFVLNYTITSGEVITSDNNVLTYVLPVGLTYDLSTSGYTTWNGKTVGEYSITQDESGNYVLKLVFYSDSEFFETATAFSGKVKFISYVGSEASSTQTTLTFIDDFSFTYTVTETQQTEQSEINTDSSFNVEKSGKTATSTNGDLLMHYDLEVTPGTYGATNVTFTDNLSVSVSGFDYATDAFQNIVVKDNDGTELTRIDVDSCKAGSSTTETETDSDGNTTTIVTTPYIDSGTGKTCYSVVTTTVTNSAGEEISTNTLTVPAAGYYYVVNNGDGTCKFILPDFVYEEVSGSVSPGSYTVSYDVDISGLDSDLSVTNYSLNNTVYDGNGSSKDTNWASFTNSWVKKSSSMTTDSNGDYVINWTVTVNPDYKEIQASDTFKDTISTTLDSSAYNSKLVSITVTDANGTEITVTAAELSGSLDWKTIASGDKTVADILSALADASTSFTYDNTKSTTEYSIVFNYTTTVSTEDLPNGYSTINNKATLSGDGEGGASSASGSQTMNNELVTKSCIGADYVEVTYITETGSTEEAIDEVAKIQWSSTIKIPSADNINAANLIIDAFSDENLWTTAELLATTTELTITSSDGSESVVLNLGEDKDYIILNNDTNIQTNYTGTDYSELKLTDGFSIQFTDDGITKLKAYAGGKISLLYYTYGTFSDLTADNTTRTFKNTISYNGNNASAEFSYSGSYFSKKYATNSGSGQTNEAELNIDDEIWWRVETKLMEEAIGSEVTLIDELPAGIDLVSLEVTEYFGAGTTGVLTDFSEDGTATLVYHDRTKYTVKVSVTEKQDGTTTIAVTLPSELTAALDLSGDHWFTLEIKAKVSDDEDINNYASTVTRAYYTNTARMLVGGTEKNVSQQTVKVVNDKANIEKAGALVDGTSNRVAYTLEVNKGQQTLNQGGNGTLTLIDTLTYNPDYIVAGSVAAEDAMSVELVSGEVHAYYYSADGKWIELPDGSYDFSYTYGTEEQSDGTIQNTLTMTIPDGLYIKVVYVYEMISSGEVNNLSAWSLSNKATLYEAGEESSESQKDYSYVDSGSTVTKIPTFYKVDENNYNTLLDGAKFTLWKYESSDWTQVGTTVYGSVNGKFDLTGVYDSLETDTLYRLEETAAPTGYKLPDSPYTYFYLKESVSASELERPSDVDAADITNMSAHDTVYITNSVNGSITVTKEWETEANSSFTATSITVALYKGTSPGYTYEDITDDNDLTKGLVKVDNSVTITSNKEWSNTWSDLPTTDSTSGLKLYYYVFEEKVNGDGTVSYSNGSYTVNGFSVDYANNGIQSGEITITNKPKSISATKKWADGTTKSDVTFTLYRGTTQGLSYSDTLGSAPALTKVEDQNIENPKMITADSSDTTVTWSGLASEDSYGNTYYYYVFETSTSTTPAGTTVSETDQEIIYTSDGYQINGYWASYANNSGIVDGTITVTNSTKSISATKAWGTGTTAVDVAFTLYQGTSASLTYDDIAASNLTLVASDSVSEGNPQTILASEVSAGNADWTVTWSGLPTVNAAGEPLYYYVFETSIGGTNYTTATAIYDDSGKLTGYMVGNYYAEYGSTSGMTDGTVTITNQDTSISVKKEWDSSITTTGAVTMGLYSSTTAPTEQSNDTSKTVYIYYKYKDQKIDWGKYYNGEAYYSTAVTSSSLSGTSASFSFGFVATTDITLTAEDISVGCDSTSVKISDISVSGSGTEWTISWNASGIYESCNFFALVGTTYGYYPKDGVITDLSGQIKDENLSMPSDATLVSSASVTLDGTTDAFETVAWNYTWSNLPVYNSYGERIYYYVKEVDADTYYASYSYTYIEDSDGNIIGIDTVTITNFPGATVEKTTTNISLEKDWKDENGDPIAENGASITLKLYQRESATAPAGSSGGDVSLTASVEDNNGNSKTLISKTSYASGTIVEITITSYFTWNNPLSLKETPNGVTLKVQDSYTDTINYTTYYYEKDTYEITLNDDIELTFLNNIWNSTSWYDCITVNEPVVTYKPEASTGSGTSATPESGDVLYATIVLSSSSATVTYADGTKATDSVTLSSDNTVWTYALSGLPASVTTTTPGGTTSTVYYSYFVVESSVTNYETSYSNNGGIGSGTIVVTNKKKTTSDAELPETGGTGTTPYTYGGLLLTLSAAGLLVYKRKKHGKEVRSGPS
ncbi:MAG: Cna B-type domain-containing protein [Clostridiales bacterium]|nr:Cna B-type domain-containing protein [Clostridiales bacterium]